MERNWQVIAPVDSAEMYARVQRHAADQQDRGGGKKDSRKRQPEDGFEKGTANADKAEASEFKSCLFYEFLMRARTDSQKVKVSIDNMTVERQADHRPEAVDLFTTFSFLGMNTR